MSSSSARRLRKQTEKNKTNQMATVLQSILGDTNREALMAEAERMHHLAHHTEASVKEALRALEEGGVRIDTDYVKQLRQEMAAESKILRELITRVGVRGGLTADEIDQFEADIRLEMTEAVVSTVQPSEPKSDEP